MNNPALIDHDPGPRERNDPGGKGRPGPILLTLQDLLRHLAEACEEGPEASQEVDQRWEDRDCTYLEIDLPDAAEVELDLCVHQGRVYIRMAR